jgi:hypothetical protein
MTILVRKMPARNFREQDRNAQDEFAGQAFA